MKKSPFNQDLDQQNLMSILIAEMDEAQLQAINKKVYKKHEYIYLPEETADRIFIIKRGRVKIGNQLDFTKEIIKKVLIKDEFFGEFSMIGQNTRTDFAIAMEETELYILTTHELNRLMRSHSELMIFMMNALGNRLMNMEQRLESFVFKTSRTRIIDFLNDLVHRRGQRVGYEMVIRKFFTHQEIANITATSRQTVTTVLNDLRNRNILTFNRRRLLIRSIDRLQAEVA